MVQVIHHTQVPSRCPKLSDTEDSGLANVLPILAHLQNQAY